MNCKYPQSDLGPCGGCDSIRTHHQPKGLSDTCQSNDKVLYREKHSEHWGSFDDTLFVTDSGGIGINVGGSVYVMPLKKWHELAGGPIKGLKE